MPTDKEKYKNHVTIVTLKLNTKLKPKGNWIVPNVN